jgi:hypothetical protein
MDDSDKIVILPTMNRSRSHIQHTLPSPYSLQSAHPRTHMVPVSLLLLIWINPTECGYRLSNEDKDGEDSEDPLTLWLLCIITDLVPAPLPRVLESCTWRLLECSIITFLTSHRQTLEGNSALEMDTCQMASRSIITSGPVNNSNITVPTGTLPPTRASNSDLWVTLASEKLATV